MADVEPEPEKQSTALTLTDMPEAIVEHIGKQFTHTGGYKDKLRLGMVTGNVGASTRLGAKLHYYTERLQSALNKPFVYTGYENEKVHVSDYLTSMKIMSRGGKRNIPKTIFREYKQQIDRGLVNRFERPLPDRGR